MFSEQEVIGLQAERHDLVVPEAALTAEQYNLFLIHEKAYRIAARVAAGRRVLDLGCNTGYGTALLARRAAAVIGVDVAPRAVAEGHRRYPGLDLRLVDGRALPFPDASFDLVVSFQVLEHVADTARYLVEIKRVLAQNGLAMLTTPNASLRLAPGMRPWNPFHVREYGASQLEALLGRHFASSRVKGLFADEPLHALELRRAARLRERARCKQSRWYRLKAALRRADGSDARAAPALADVMRCSASAFRYRSTGLDGALDLLALCKP